MAEKSINILVIRFSSLGDLILITPIFRELKRVYPHAKITLLTSKGFGEILENNPHIDEVTYHQRNETWQELQQLIQNLKQHSFEVIYDVHRSLRSRWIVWRLRGFGGQTKPQLWAINKRTWKRNVLVFWKINLLKNSLSQREYFLLPLQKRTDMPLNSDTELFPSSAAQEKIRQLLENRSLRPHSYICLGPSASFPLKRWPVHYYQKLIEWLLGQGWSIILVGAPDEEEPKLLEAIFGESILNLAGSLTLLESAEILRHAFLVIGNDTSISHMAEAMGTQVYTFFGPTVREFGFAPYLKNSHILEVPLPCRPCTRTGKGRCKLTEPILCLTSITPESVIQRLDIQK